MSTAATAAIDVICPAWNRSEAIRPTIDSVLAQTFEDWRLIVVSDGCTDDTDDVVRSYEDERVQLIRTERHGHPGGPRNIGLAASTAPAIAYLDYDDEWLPDHLAVLRRELDAGARLVATASIGMNDKGEEEYRSHPLNGLWHPDLQLLWPLYEPSRVGHVRGLPESVGGWTTEQTGMEDWDLWLRLSDAGERFTTVLDRTVRMHLSDTSRRHTMAVRHRLDLGTLPDEAACTKLTEAIGTPAVQDELRACFAGEMLRFYRSIAEAGELVTPRGMTYDEALTGLEKFVTDPAVPMLRELTFAAEEGGFAVVHPLQCASERHAERLREFLLLRDAGRHAIVRRLIAAVGA
ncbi:glycosyltransferase family 2 protein [Streptomyces parvus]|uniref:Glycosyltransferase family 2 protein n=1 Tax=Streptomyces parvus TaxID=66428 RepID=A0A7K3RY31_9ACTN|nr:glycosyltransferase family 2 protein [Streptomyces parvus]NEC20059.1 glycosyltransferase family 2 protein [Streptomyces parvus]